MKQLYIHNDLAYLISRTIRKEQFQNDQKETCKDILKEYRDFLHCDKVLETASHFIFCNTIPDVEWEPVVIDDTLSE